MAQGKQVRRRGTRRPRNMKKKGPSNKSLNKKIKHIENNLMELKFLDTNSGVTPSIAGVSDYLSGLAQGDTASLRQGNIINPTSIQIRATMFTDIDTLSISQIRVILFWDRQPNGAAPVLSGASTTQSLLDTGVVTNPILSPRNFNTIERYGILWDKVVQLNPNVPLLVAGGATTQVVQVGKFLSKVIHLSRLVKYNNTSAAITASVSNALHCAFFTNLAADVAIINLGYRLYYRDS